MLLFGVVFTPDTLGDIRLAVAQKPIVAFHRLSMQDRLDQMSSRGEIRSMKMLVTAYDLSYESCGKYPGDPAYGITASGERIKPGYVAVDPTVIPMHSRLYIPGYGMAYASDTGGAVKGRHIDVYIPDRHDALKWGRKIITVYILGYEIPEELKGER
jgi:3D (Asp-Asp-Asp) domain-containing protein